MSSSNIYQSEFTGPQMDSKFSAVATLQEAVAALETAVAAKYSKPDNGIPSTDMDADVQAALALALTAVQSLADYYTKAQVDAIAAAIASAVNSTSGVTVTTLPSASADTLGKIYYVGPDGNGEYARKVTSYDGTTYSWLDLGTTAIDLTQYATKAELSQLDQEVAVLGDPTDCPGKVIDVSGLTVYEKYIINSSNLWQTNSGWKSKAVFIPLTGGTRYRVVHPSDSQFATLNVSVLTQNTPGTNNSAPAFAPGFSGRISVDNGDNYDFVAPSGAYLFVVFVSTGGVVGIYRAEEVSIVDTLNALEASGQDAKERNALSRLGGSFDGKNMTFSSASFYGIAPGRQYRVHIVNPDVSVSKLTTSTYARFAVSVFVNGAEVNLVRVNCNKLSEDLAPFYDFDVPAVIDYVLVGGRCDDGSTLRFYIEENASANIQKLTFNSSANDTDVSVVRAKFCDKMHGKDKIDTFLFFSDPHLAPYSRYETMTEVVRDKYISALQKYYNSLPLDNCICGGDLLNYADTKGASCDDLGYFDGFMRKLFKNFHPCMGNHDFSPYTVDHRISTEKLSLKDVENMWFREEGGTYYAFDGRNTKFYVFNSGSSYVKVMSGSSYNNDVDNIRWEQVAWYASKLLADDAQFSVIVMHMYSNGGLNTWDEESDEAFSDGIFPFSKNIREVAIAYNNRSTITKNGQTYDFSACTGKVLFFICGHTHADYVDLSMELPVVVETNLEGGVWNTSTDDVDYALVPTFDNCMLDNTGNTLYMVRVGAGHSRIIHCDVKAVAASGTLTLTTELAGSEVTWATRDSEKATVSDGVVSGVAAGVVGIVATDENGEEEYWAVKVS